MADIRINSLPSTASASSSDDFLALDGATNGTRKLNAYSPTFGGNLTLSGTTSTITLGSTNTANVAVNSSGALTVTSANGQTLVSQTSSGNHYVEIKRASQSTGQVGLSLNGGTSGNTWLMYQPASSNTLTWFGNSANRMSLDTSGNLTLDTGNLTVSGGTIGTAASTNLTLNGGSSGASLVLGQGTNGSAQLASKGTGRIILQGQNPTTIAQGNESFVFSALNQGPGNVQLALGMNETGGFFPWLQSYRVGGSAGSYLVLQPAAGNVLIGATTDGGQKLQVSGTAAISGAISIGNTVNTVSPTSPNRTITIVVGGTTYYIPAKTTND